MKRNSIRDFWILLLLCCGIFGLQIIKAEETVFTKAMVLVNEGRTDEAIDLLRRETGQGVTMPEVHLALGMAYLEKGDYTLSQENLEKVLQAQPDSVPAHYTLAMLYEKRRMRSAAVSEWEKVRSLTPDADLKVLSEKHLRQLKGAR